MGRIGRPQSELSNFENEENLNKKYRKDGDLVVDDGGKEFLGLFEGDVAAVGVVAELLFADVTHREIVCFGMGKHEARDAAMGIHGSILGEGDAYL